MEYIKTYKRAELTRMTLSELDKLASRLRIPGSMNIPKTMEQKEAKIIRLLKYYRRLFDAGKTFIEVKDAKAKARQAGLSE